VIRVGQLKAGQIDIVFVPEHISSINSEYFENNDIVYKALADFQSWRKMIRSFSETIGDASVERMRRCVILIMAPNDLKRAAAYIYEPMQCNSVPTEFCDWTEFAYVRNTKSEFLPKRTIDGCNGLCLSIHVHPDVEGGLIERVYLTDGQRNTRVFKSTLKEALEKFGIEYEEDLSDVNWSENAREHEFQDHQFSSFVDSLFSDFDLLPTAEGERTSNRWSALFHTSTHNPCSPKLSQSESVPLDFDEAL